MVRTKEFREILALTAKQTGVPIGDVDRTVEFYFKTISNLVQWDNPVTIHMNYIGDFVYNQKWKNKVEHIIEEKKLAEREYFVIPKAEYGTDIT